MSRKLRAGDPRNTGRWRRLAERIRIERRSECERCKAPAKDCHHRVALHKGGEPFDRANVELLCSDCHKREHEHEGRSRLVKIPGRTEALASVLAKMQEFQL